MARRYLDVVEPSQLVRSLQQLQAAVFGVCVIESDHEAEHFRLKAPIIVPIAVVLMPLPCAAIERLLRRKFGVVVINLAAEQILHGVHHAT